VEKKELLPGCGKNSEENTIPPQKEENILIYNGPVFLMAKESWLVLNV